MLHKSCDTQCDVRISCFGNCKELGRLNVLSEGPVPGIRRDEFLKHDLQLSARLNLMKSLWAISRFGWP